MTKRTFNRSGRELRTSASLDRIARILAGEVCENCGGPGPTTKLGLRYLCVPCAKALDS